MKHTIYQIFTRLFGNTKTGFVPHGGRDENGVGTLADITDTALVALADLGVSHVWYTGVIRHGTMATDNPMVVKGRAGSPYAITDYYDVNPDLSVDPLAPREFRMGEFISLLERTHKQGLKALIDFVPNHVARTYKSEARPFGVMDFGEGDDTSVGFLRDNNFYYFPGEALKLPQGYTPSVKPSEAYVEMPARATGNDVFTPNPGIDDWFETVKLNYGVDYANGRQGHFNPVPDTWQKMRHILLYWASKGVDGFRCDMAEMVPVEFWGWVIPEVKHQYPGILFIAEIYNPRAYEDYLYKGAFDLLYDKVGMYDAVRTVIEGRGTVDAIIAAWQAKEPIQEYLLDFLENHDEQRIASRFFGGTMEANRPGLAVMAGLGKGPVMVYFGQEVGEPALGVHGFSGDDGRTSIFDYISVPEHQKWMNHGAFDGGLLDLAQSQLRDFHRRVLGDCRDNEVLRRGSTTLIQGTGPKLLAWVREHEGRQLLFAANFDRDQPASFTYHGSVHRVQALGCIWADVVKG